MHAGVKIFYGDIPATATRIASGLLAYSLVQNQFPPFWWDIAKGIEHGAVLHKKKKK
jgi:hypothetical protein